MASGRPLRLQVQLGASAATPAQAIAIGEASGRRGAARALERELDGAIITSARATLDEAALALRDETGVPLGLLRVRPEGGIVVWRFASGACAPNPDPGMADDRVQVQWHDPQGRMVDESAYRPGALDQEIRDAAVVLVNAADAWFCIDVRHPESAEATEVWFYAATDLDGGPDRLVWEAGAA